MRDLSPIHVALRGRGFTQDSNSPPKTIRYSGVLRCTGVDVPVHLEITDPEFVTLPKITLIKRPPGLPAVCSHLGDDNGLCYLSAKTAHIDLYGAPQQVLGCIDAAESVLSRLMAGDALADTRDEFSVYWRGEIPLLIDLAEKDKTAIAWKIGFSDDREKWILSSNEAAVKAKYERVGGNLAEKGAPAYVLPAVNAPLVHADRWPPKTMGDIAAWFRNGARDTYKVLEHALKAFHQSHSTHDRVIFLFKHERAWFGFSVLFDKEYRSKHTAAKQWIQHVLHGRGSQKAISRLIPVRIDQPYLVSRNLAANENTLAGKRIVLAGCGAIGGYLAELLVRAGAGTGGGQLTLVDPDILLPGNLGRHVLGFQDLFRNKAEAVRDWILGRFPGVIIFAIEKDIRGVPMKNTDLLIDATGEEALSTALNSRFLAGSFPPVLYSWIKGPGTAAQCLLVDSLKEGCYRCLKTADGLDRASPLATHVESAVMGHGCDDYYVPFSAAASMQAAALAGQLVLDWANGRATPRLRTRIMNYDNKREIKDKDLARAAGCPACGG